MTNAEIINMIKNEITVTDGQGDYFVGMRNGMKWCLSLLDGKEPLFDCCIEQEPKWITVSKRLPKPFSFVNCTCHSLIDDREDWVVETFYLPQLPNSPYSDWGNIPMLNSCECEVIAWMYRDIPEPYKAEGSDKE